MFPVWLHAWYKHASRNYLFNEVKIHGRSSDTGSIDCMVIDQAIYLGKNDALDDFRFVMANRTGQYVCLLLSASLYVLLNWFNVHRYRDFLWAQSCMDVPFYLLPLCTVFDRKRHVFYWFHDSYNHMEANVLVVWAPSS